MRILVCIKQVPDTTEVKLDPKTNTLIREGLPSIINPDDNAAIEEALRLKDECGAEVVLLSMGPHQAEHALREGLAMGADRGILLSSRSFGGADTWATSLTLAGAYKKLGEADLIFCGRQAIDGDTAQVGPEMAEHLGIPQVTYVQKILSVQGDFAVVERALEDGYEVVKVTLPATLTFVKEANAPRYPTMWGIVDAYDAMEVEVWDEKALDIDIEELGLKGSPTKVIKSFPPAMKEPGIIVTGINTADSVSKLVRMLVDKKQLSEG